MFAEFLGRVRHPTAMSPFALFRVGVNVLGMSALGILFCRPHRLLPPTGQIGSAGFCEASAMFFAAAALRHSVFGGKPLDTVFMASAMSYGVLLLVSIANCMPEFTLCLCVSVGIDLVASCLALTGLAELNGEIGRSWLFAWQLAAMFTAMVQLRLSRLPASTD